MQQLSGSVGFGGILTPAIIVPFRLFSSSRFPGPARRDPNTTRAFSTRVSASAVVVGLFGEKGSVGDVVAGGCGTPGGRGFAG